MAYFHKIMYSEVYQLETFLTTFVKKFHRRFLAYSSVRLCWSLFNKVAGL